MNLIEDFSLLFAAFIASIFGQGGGILYTPLQLWTGVDFSTAAATSLFLILATSISSTVVFQKSNSVDWNAALALEGPTTLGAFIGGRFSHLVSPVVLSLLLSILLFGVAWFMFRPPKRCDACDKEKARSRWHWERTFRGETYHLDLRLIIPVMLAVGFITSMVGIGGGALKVPLMILLFRIPTTIAIGSSAFMVGLTAASGLLGHIGMGGFDWQTALILVVPVFIGGQLGSRMSLRLNVRRLQKWFGVFILFVAVINAIRIV